MRRNARSKSRRNRIGIGEIVWLAVLIILAILIIYRCLDMSCHP